VSSDSVFPCTGPRIKELCFLLFSIHDSRFTIHHSSFYDPERGGRMSKEAQFCARSSQHQRYRLYVDKSGSTVASYLHFFPVTSSPFSFSSCLSQMHYPLERVQRIRNLVTPSWQGCILPTSSTALLLW